MGNYWDIEELAYRAMGNNEEETDDLINNGDIDQALCDKYEISFETYEKIVMDLVPFTITNESPLTGKKFKGFVDAEESRFILKVEEK